MPALVVIGSTNTDLVVPVPRIPGPGETILGGALAVVAGGKGANQAVAAARLGARVAFVARVGDDAYGTAALEGFRRDQIDTRFVTVTPGVASGVALIAVDSHSAENSIVVAPGANACLCAADIRAAASVFASADTVLISLEIPEAAVEAAILLATEHHARVVVNPAPARRLSPELLAKIDVLTPNATELALLGGVDELLTAGVGAVVTTLGGRGATITTAAATVALTAPTVAAVDTVGAGDCFTAALAVALSEGCTLSDAARFACAAAALKVTRHGAQPGMPTRTEVEGFGANASP